MIRRPISLIFPFLRSPLALFIRLPSRLKLTIAPQTKMVEPARSPSGQTVETIIKEVEVGIVEKERTPSDLTVGFEQQPTRLSDPVGKVQLQEEVDYHALSWPIAGIIMIAETVSLGILSLPHTLAVLGFVPGVILILVFGFIATYTGYVTWQFKMAHPDHATFADLMGVAFGRPGRWLGLFAQQLLLIFVMGAHIVVASVSLNTLTKHASCTVVFMVVGAAVSFVCTLWRAFNKASIFSVFSCLSIATATTLAMIDIGIHHTGVGDTYAVVPANLTSFAGGAAAVSQMILAYNGHIAYPSIISEMKRPEDFPKALALLAIFTISMYLTVAVVIYNYAGQGVVSPALGSASPLIRKIAYGLATPTIIIAGVIPALVASKQVYERVWRHSPEVMKEKSSFRANASWIAIALGHWVIAFVIAGLIPTFHELLGFIGALLGVWFVLGFCAMFGVKVNWPGSGLEWTLKQKLLVAVNFGLVAMCIVLCGVGTYGSIVKIVRGKESRGVFSCATNAHWQ
ncbi:hypothetical protein BAUCODRAFT_106132 [Baudoinia panamericana UAMH 10762]|uniref:Amino acid transporter transmembrane domain-containing protein n=1 Tax=Baudoinia panamericana (strain UAMH 10762) TaxID=717646 RepID=M2LR83_BAUPA|nr:uncharacterized protein BAUCODRAFT_106132 [Baudoinia panamericana UAMH 10762]EMC96947.1 hypothetical protein BAUCODRAFT_106132 [Baudoinia panamericana UAMH 10762]